MTYMLAIADRSYSSWSLRGWLMFARFDLPVTLRPSRELYDPGFLDGARRLRLRPATVPALRIDGGRPRSSLWDSLAIAETLAERHPRPAVLARRPGARAASPARSPPRCTRASARCARPAR